MTDIQVGMKVFANGHRWEVLEIKRSFAKLKLLGNKKDTGEPIELHYTEEIPITSLTPLDELK